MGRRPRKVGADDLGGLDQRVQDLAGPGDEGDGATGPGCTSHVPGVGRDQPHLPDGHPEPLGRHQIRLRRRLEPAHRVGRQDQLEAVEQTGILQLRPGDLLGRVG